MIPKTIMRISMTTAEVGVKFKERRQEPELKL